MNRLFILLVFSMNIQLIHAQTKREVIEFEFEFEGVTLNGVLNLPENNVPKGIVLVVHGSGRTNAVAQEWYMDVRQTILKAGYGTYMWDKIGCGKSGGTFDYNQPVENSAMEAIAAIQALKNQQIPGAETIGLWGISRAGWVNPLIIQQYKDIRFWISVSGVDEKENFRYLLEQNLRINGHPRDSVELLVNEWLSGVQITHSGGSYASYLAATSNIRKNPFMVRFNGGHSISSDEYYAFQSTFMQEAFDEASGLQVYIKDFEDVLSTIECPVLALFGEIDMNVDWTKTKALYERALGEKVDLTIKSFPDCNHNIFQCKTGGFYEMQDDNLPWNRCVGFLDTMAEWMNER